MYSRELDVRNTLVQKFSKMDEYSVLCKNFEFSKNKQFLPKMAIFAIFSKKIPKIPQISQNAKKSKLMVKNSLEKFLLA